MCASRAQFLAVVMESEEAPLIMRILAASHSVSVKAAEMITSIMKAGDLGVVVKYEIFMLPFVCIFNIVTLISLILHCV